MGLNLRKLENVVFKADGSVIAGCPVCIAEGADSTRDHLWIGCGEDGQPGGGRFGCVVDQSKVHRSMIARLAGDRKFDQSRPVAQAKTPAPSEPGWKTSADSIKT